MTVSMTVHSYHFLDSSISSVQVKDAGHMVPMDQPRNSLEMIRRWTRGISLGTQISKTIPELKTLQPSSVFSSSWLMLQLLVYYSAPQSQGPLCGPCREPHSKKPKPIPYYICAWYPIMLDAKWTPCLSSMQQHVPIHYQHKRKKTLPRIAYGKPTCNITLLRWSRSSKDYDSMQSSGMWGKVQVLLLVAPDSPVNWYSLYSCALVASPWALHWQCPKIKVINLLAPRQSSLTSAYVWPVFGRYPLGKDPSSHKSWCYKDKLSWL